MADNRYTTGASEGERLENKLGLTDPNAINEEEAAGFLRAEHSAIDALSERTGFSLGYLYGLHKDALGHLYDFAGRLRTVNMSKGDFLFASAEFLPQTMQTFEKEYLKPVNARDWDGISLLEHLAEMHAELLYIHPFREGNGRIIRLFTKLIFLAKAGKELHFDVINQGDNLKLYIAAVQQASKKEYTLMKELFRKTSS